MATSTKSPQRPGQAPPTPPAKANGQTPPADWTFPKPKGTSALTPEQRAALQATPPAKADGKPQASAKPPKKPAAPKGPKPGEAYYVAKLGTEDIWHFAPLSVEPGAAVMVRHFKGYDLLREHRRSATFASKLYHDLLAAGFVYIDGKVHRLVDEMV